MAPIRKADLMPPASASTFDAPPLRNPAEMIVITVTKSAVLGPLKVIASLYVFARKNPFPLIY